MTTNFEEIERPVGFPYLFVHVQCRNERGSYFIYSLLAKSWRIGNR